MRASTLKKLEIARENSGLQFIVTSGYRTESHNKKVGGVIDSSHILGYAVDLLTTTKNEKQIANSLVNAGFKRLGIGTGFIHVDDDPTKPTPAIWGYPLGTKPRFNPF